jgi:hypothetical protein
MQTKDRRGKSWKKLESHSSQKVAVRSQKASSASRWATSPSSRSEAKYSLKLTKRSLNVYENKGSAWKEQEEAGISRNLRGSYAFAEGILCFKVGNKSIQSERDKELFKTHGTKRECLLKQRVATERMSTKRECR